MSRTRRIIAAASILGTAGFGSFAAASLAGATTSQCASNPYCYTQEVHGTNLVMSTNRGHNNAHVIVERQSSHSTDSDFLAGLAPFPTQSNAKLFEYAPRGHLSGLCVTEPWHHASLVLRGCDGSANQAWDATQVGNTFEWLNEATGDAMTDPGHNHHPGNAGTQLTGSNVTGHGDQLWDAVNH
ncbi:MAG TPA: hypothetical protein VIZ20_22535 [Streptosporangiaceae bacterium]|jgi:hypothetical protein